MTCSTAMSTVHTNWSKNLSLKGKNPAMYRGILLEEFDVDDDQRAEFGQRSLVIVQLDHLSSVVPEVDGGRTIATNMMMRPTR